MSPANHIDPGGTAVERRAARRLHGVAAVVALLATILLCATPAAAKLVHREEGSFSAADAPGGPFGPLLDSAAVDQSSGDVWVLETNWEGFGQGLIDRFEADGTYAGVQITGASTPAGSFAFTSLFAGKDSGIAVDDSTAHPGAVYVADTEHGLVDRFSEAGAFECQISGKTPGSAEEIANECNGAAGSKTPQVGIEPAGLAVDSTSGNLYVADDAHEAIDVFAPSGAYLEQILDSHLGTSMATIALDSGGRLYVTNLEANVAKFKPNGEFDSLLFEGSAQGVAVDPASDHVYVGEGEGVAEYDSSAAAFATIPNPPGATPLPALAVDGTSGRIYGGEELNFGGTKVYILGPDLTVPDVTTEAASGVEETGATLNGTVNPDAVAVTSCEFEYGLTSGYGETVICGEDPLDEIGEGTEPVAVAADVALQPSTTYHFRLRAANAEGSEVGADETLTTFGPPAIEAESSHIASRNGTLTAQITPFGFETSCEAQLVDQASFEASGYAQAHTLSCNPAAVGSGFSPQTVTVSVSGLQVGSSYHYRFLATNSANPTTGEDKTFATFGPTDYSFEVLDEAGHPQTQAGAHPYEIETNFDLATTPNTNGEGPVANLKDAFTELPPGLIGNPSATPKCSRDQLTNFLCPGASQVGVLHVREGQGIQYEVGIYNLVPPQGVAAEFGARLNTLVNAYFDGEVRTGGDYGINVKVSNVSAAVGVVGATASFWGVPASESHDAVRFCPNPNAGELEINPCSIEHRDLRPFLSNPTACGTPLTASFAVDSWQTPGEFVGAEAALPAITGCEELEFEPTLEAQPTNHGVADSPTGLHVDLHLPQHESCEEGPPVSCEPATANLKDAVVTLPPGLLVNPSSANGLAGCSSAQIDLHGAGPANCPDAAKIGTVEVDTPLLDHPLPGSVYIASPHDNPFGSLLAIYIAVDDPISGVVVKLAGHVEADPATGQLTTTFAENPQLPFEDFKLDFFAGPRAPLRTPAICGAFQTTSVLTPWSAPASGPPATPADSFAVASAPGGGACPTEPSQLPNAPGFEAGTQTPTAGAYSPFVLKLDRPDGSQEISAIDTTLPEGLLGRLAGIPYCSEAALATAAGKSGAAEQAGPSCPASSQVGVVNVGAGAGPQPYYVQGRAYLAGPYKGAPLSLAILTPALAGPFDLGTVVVRTALYVNETTAQIHAVSDPIPTILQGIPLDVRSIALNMNKPNFTLNPTSCDPKQITGTATSILGTAAPLAQRFQVGGCGALKFKPKLSLSLKGGTRRHTFPSLKAVLTYPKGSYANIAKAQVTLPHSEFLEQGHIGTVCTRVQFAAGAGHGSQCPKASIYGKAMAISPLLDKPVSGPVYLRSSSNELPDLVAALNGQIDVVLAGKIDTGKGGGIRNTFQAVPDAPVSKFVLEMKGGKKGLLVNSENLCSPNAETHAEANLTAQNGKTFDTTPVVVNSCGSKKHKGHKNRTAHK